jgi:ABC-2 type transport system permease protein
MAVGCHCRWNDGNQALREGVFLNARRLRWIVARNEWRLLFIERTALLAMLATALAVAYAATEGLSRAHRWRESLVEYESLQSFHLARFERRAQAILEQLAGNSGSGVRIHKREFGWGPHVPDFALAWVPPKATLPPAPLAAAAVGDSETWFVAYGVSPSDRDPLETAEQPGNPLESTLGRLDMAFVVIVLFPLFIITLTHGVFSTERDGETLALILAHPVGGATLTMGKLMARGSVAVLWPTALVGVALSLEAARSEGGVFRLGLWLAAMLAYGLFWVALAFWFDSRARSAAVSAVVLGGVWLFLTIVSPAILSGVLQTLHPIPPAAQWLNSERASDHAARLATTTLDEKEQREFVAQMLAENPDMEQDISLYKDTALLRAVALAAKLRATRELEAVRQSVEGPRNAQRRLLSVLRFISPAISLQGMLYDLSGAGPSRYEDFLQQTRNFQHEVEQWALDRRLRNIRMTHEQYASIPRFHYVEETTGTAVRLIAVPFVALWALAAIVALYAFRATARITP